MSSWDVQQRDGAGQHIAVQAVSGGDVLRRDGSCGAERAVQRGLLLQRGLSGGQRERVRCARGVQRDELWRLRGRVSCGVVLPFGVGAADALRCGAVLRDSGAVAGERAVRRRVLLRECWGLERAAGRESGRVRAVSCWAVLPCGDSGAFAVSQGDFLGDGGQQECVGLRGVCCWALLSLRGHDEREHVPVQCWLLLSGGYVGRIASELRLWERFLLPGG